MKYNSIRKMDVSNGPGIRISIFVQGCDIKCPHCFNKELWDSSKGKDFTEKEFNLIINLLNNDHINGISWLGGEPTLYLNEIFEINNRIKKLYPNKTIWLYTGKLFETLNKELISNVDVIVDGPFINELKNPNLVFKGSENQRIIDVNKSLINDNIELYENNSNLIIDN